MTKKSRNRRKSLRALASGLKEIKAIRDGRINPLEIWQVLDDRAFKKRIKKEIESSVEQIKKHLNNGTN